MDTDDRVLGSITVIYRVPLGLTTTTTTTEEQEQQEENGHAHWPRLYSLPILLHERELMMSPPQRT